MKKFKLFFVCYTLFTQPVFALENPTIVFAAANTPNSTQNISIVEQPDNSPNPLGDPIVGPYVAPQAYNAADASPENNIPSATPSNHSPQDLGSQFKNTLLEGNGEIYDIQSYPTQDLNAISKPNLPATIYSPNVNP